MSRSFSWCEDSTNKENDYTRNKIRNELLPWVTENINSRAAEHILAVSEFAAQADAYFEMEAERILEESCSKRREEGKQPNSKNAGEADGKEPGTGQSSKVAENEMKMCTKINTDIFDSTARDPENLHRPPHDPKRRRESEGYHGTPYPLP